MMSEYDENIGNFEISFEGRFSSQIIIEELTSVLITLQQKFDVEEFADVKLCCELYRDEKQQVFVNKKNIEEQIAGIGFKSNSSHKTITKQEDGSKIYKFDKDFNFENFKNNV